MGAKLGSLHPAKRKGSILRGGAVDREDRSSINFSSKNGAFPSDGLV